MFEKLQQWKTKRTITKAVKDALAEHQGVAAKGWPLTSDAPPATLAIVAEEIRGWIEGQLPYTATPHGISGYTVSLGFAAMQEEERTYLGQQQLAQFDRLDAPTALDTIQHQVATLDLAGYPTLTLLEVYLFSFGDMIKPVLDQAAGH